MTQGSTGGSGPAEQGAVVLRSEFATVRVMPDNDANGPRLRVEDLRTGRSICLDPLELEWIAWSTHAELVRLLPRDYVVPDDWQPPEPGDRDD